MDIVTQYRNIYRLALNKAFSPNEKMNVLEIVLANTIARHSSDVHQKALVEWSGKIKKKNAEYLINYRSAKAQLDAALKNLIFGQQVELLPDYIQKNKKALAEHFKGLVDAFNQNLAVFEQAVFELDASNALGENQVTTDELKTLPVDLQNQWIRAQCRQKLFKQVYSPIRLDLQVKAFFEKWDKQNLPKELKEVKAESKKDPEVVQSFENMWALRKAHEEFEQANEAYQYTQTTTAKDLANKKYQKFLEMARLCAHKLFNNIAKTEEEENNRLKKLIEETKSQRNAVWKYVFIKKVAAMLHIPIKIDDPAETYGIFAEEFVAEVSSDVENAIKFVLDDEKLRALSQKHEALIFKIYPFADVIPNYYPNRTGEFSKAYKDMLEARKLFLHSYSRAKKENSWLDCQAKLQKLIDTIDIYQEKLKSINELVMNNSVRKTKEMVKSAAKIEYRQDKIFQLETVEFWEKMQNNLGNPEFKTNIENQAGYLIEQLNGLNPSIINSQLVGVAEYILKNELFNSINSPTESPEGNWLNAFKNMVNPHSPQKFLENKLNDLKLAEQKLAQEKVIASKSYKAALENLQTAKRQFELAKYFIVKVIVLSYRNQAKADNPLPDMPRPFAVHKAVGKEIKHQESHLKVPEMPKKVAEKTPIQIDDDFLKAEPSPDELRESKRKQKITTEEIELQSLPDVRSRFVESKLNIPPKPEPVSYSHTEISASDRDPFLYAQPSPDELREKTPVKKAKPEEFELTTFTPKMKVVESKRSIPSSQGSDLTSPLLSKPKNVFPLSKRTKSISAVAIGPKKQAIKVRGLLPTTGMMVGPIGSVFSAFTSLISFLYKKTQAKKKLPQTSTFTIHDPKHLNAPIAKHAKKPGFLARIFGFKPVVKKRVRDDYHHNHLFTDKSVNHDGVIKELKSVIKNKSSLTR